MIKKDTFYLIFILKLNIKQIKMNKFDFITDPDDPEIRESLEVLLGTIKDDYIIETSKDKGLVRYEIYSDQNLNPIINKISYEPIVIVVKSEPKYNEGLKTIVKALTEKLLNITIKNVETITMENNMTTFSPIDTDNKSIYANPNYINDYYKNMNISKYLGYEVLSNDPLVTLFTKPINIEGIYLIPLGNQDIIDRIGSITNKYRQDGYFVYPVGHHNKEDLLLVPELASLWETEVISTNHIDKIILKSNKMDLHWFEKNINTIKNGMFPSITVYGTWQFDVGGDYNRIYDKPMYKYILYYAGLLAYKKLTDNDTFLAPFTQSVKINNDLSITISVPTYNHSVLFKEKLKEVLTDQDLFETVYCKGLIDGIVKKHYVQGIDSKSNPMVLPGESGDVLIFRSPTTTEYNSPYNFDQVNHNKLMKDMKTHYNNCHDNMEPVTLDMISAMDLGELLDLVQISENSVKFCYSKNTLLSLTKPVNPMTRRPFKDNVLIKAMMTEWGLRGLFDVGPVKGLYNDMPEKILIKPKIGVIDVMFDQNNQIYDIVVTFGDYEQVIFSISTTDKNELKRMVTELWDNGFFLSYWSASLQKYSNPEMYQLNVTNPILIHAADSKDDGDHAMNYLKSNL